MKKILFATSETHPLIKTGGLADVAGSLPLALGELEQDVRIIMPNYQAIRNCEPGRYLCTVKVNNCDVNLLETWLPGSQIPVWLVDYPPFFKVPGNPYVDDNGMPWPNIGDRFALFCRIVAEVAMNRAYLDWQPDIVHCNDWQTGLVPALLSLEHQHPASVFTIHNMAYQGLFPATAFTLLNLPGQLWHPEGLEYHGMLSFIKGGLAYAERITTVSPTYAQEIQTPEFGYGLEGLLAHKQSQLSGILNGIDTEVWNPAIDPHIAQTYGMKTLNDKAANKIALQQQMNLPVDAELPVFGLIGRLVEQKGIDLILAGLPELLELPAQFVFLGSGDKSNEYRLMEFARLYPEKVAVTIGYNEPLAHQIEAGADIFLMPSRFEPCGLNQMYSQRYGTIPIVRKTGGLADTVVDTLPESIANGTATGFVFNDTSAATLTEAIKRCLVMFRHKKDWRQLQRNAMSRDFSWQSSAQRYLALYDEI
ncbi:glycogen synthase GlgA [Methylomonas sp. MED-D]|uniref:Glycogen synthase n=1 Tax=Methylomonas koyamae TaxID=702114 RepID=A0A177NBM5_9GAMM|nr:MULTISPECIES: glycogen synthase GlgA [Methylomonas]MDT4332494.1 glycogen synthase GlgA [Methylomonas sp. MV1]OAI15272.1 starch synthase [Methylomonas koyamae]OHX34688.1 starch synthase [Methylomonas sp. LWB]